MYGSGSAGAGMANPLTVQSSVVLNARYDRHFTQFRKTVAAGDRFRKLDGTMEDENFDIMPRELGMMLRQDYDSCVQRPMNYERDREIRLFTSANGVPDLDLATTLPKGKTGVTKREEMVPIRDQLVFVGVPLTKVLHVNHNQTDAVSVQVSGSTTIFNTGPYDIQPFDIVTWDLPYASTAAASAAGPAASTSVKTPPGLPSSKRSFWTVPLRRVRNCSGLFSFLCKLGNGSFFAEPAHTRGKDAPRRMLTPTVRGR